VDNGRHFSGRGVSTDVIEASAKAYLQAISFQQNYSQDKQELATV